MALPDTSRQKLSSPTQLYLSLHRQPSLFDSSSTIGFYTIYTRYCNSIVTSLGGEVQSPYTCPCSQAFSLGAEELSGPNQYMCDHCNKKADAVRQMALRKLPPYLCLQLQRFVFDYNAGGLVYT